MNIVQKALLAHLNPTEGFAKLSKLQRMLIQVKGGFGVSQLFNETDNGSNKLDCSSHSLKGAYIWECNKRRKS